MNLPSTSSASAAIAVSHLSRHFGAKRALNDVSLYVPRGCVFGLVGENGAGKTTLIKHLLGLFQAETGSVRVFDRDPVLDPVGVLSRCGYLSEHRDLPGWMTVEQLLNYLPAFYPGWDPIDAEDLRNKFGLDPRTRIRHLSQGQQAKAGLLAALAYRPELLLLDEPSSGLDPVVRRDILEAILRSTAEQGRTVLFSSHLLDEVERVSDHLAMIRNGRIVLCGRLDDIKERHHRLVVRFASPVSAPPRIEGVLAASGRGCEWSLLCAGELNRWAPALVPLGGVIVEAGTPSLDEIFLARTVSQGGPHA